MLPAAHFQKLEQDAQALYNLCHLVRKHIPQIVDAQDDAKMKRGHFDCLVLQTGELRQRGDTRFYYERYMGLGHLLRKVLTLPQAQILWQYIDKEFGKSFTTSKEINQCWADGTYGKVLDFLITLLQNEFNVVNDITIVKHIKVAGRSRVNFHLLSINMMEKM